MLNVIAIFAGLSALLFPKQAQTSVAKITAAVKKTTGEVFGPMAPPNFWYAEKVVRVARDFAIRYGLNAEPEMIAAMVKIESNFNPKAYRFERHLNDASYGLMQTMLKTAQWMYDIGYKAYARPTGTDLYDGNISIYFGMAYVDYLSKYKKKSRDEKWIVESYNGGPGNSNSGTQNHLRKYYAAKSEIA